MPHGKLFFPCLLRRRYMQRVQERCLVGVGKTGHAPTQKNARLHARMMTPPRPLARSLRETAKHRNVIRTKRNQKEKVK